MHEAEGTIRIFGHPSDVFPPTDFHTATLVGEHIWVIGSLGYRAPPAIDAGSEAWTHDTRTFVLDTERRERRAP